PANNQPPGGLQLNVVVAAAAGACRGVLESLGATVAVAQEEADLPDRKPSLGQAAQIAFGCEYRRGRLAFSECLGFVSALIDPARVRDDRGLLRRQPGRFGDL